MQQQRRAAGRLDTDSNSVQRPAAGYDNKARQNVLAIFTPMVRGWM